MPESDAVDPFPKEPGQWLGSNPLEIGAAFGLHVSQTNRPEDFPGVLDYRCRPPRGTPLVVLSRVSPDIRARDGIRVQCNQCRTANKFMYGGFAVLANGHIVIMGPVCGAEGHGVVFRQASAKFFQAQRERHAEQKLQAVIPEFGKWWAVLEEALPLAAAADSARKTARSHSRRVCRGIKQALGPGTERLLVEVPLPPELRKPRGPTTERAPLVRVASIDALISPLSALSGLLARAREGLTAFGPANATTAELEARLGALREAQRLSKAVASVLAAQKQIKEVLTSLSALRALFEEGNWSGLERWLNHKGCGVRGVAGAIGSRRLLCDISGNGRTADWFDVRALYDGALPALPQPHAVRVNAED